MSENIAKSLVLDLEKGGAKGWVRTRRVAGAKGLLWASWKPPAKAFRTPNPSQQRLIAQGKIPTSKSGAYRYFPPGTPVPSAASLATKHEKQEVEMEARLQQQEQHNIAVARQSGMVPGSIERKKGKVRSAGGKAAGEITAVVARETMAHLTSGARVLAERLRSWSERTFKLRVQPKFSETVKGHEAARKEILKLERLKYKEQLKRYEAGEIKGEPIPKLAADLAADPNSEYSLHLRAEERLKYRQGEGGGKAPAIYVPPVRGAAGRASQLDPTKRAIKLEGLPDIGIDPTLRLASYVISLGFYRLHPTKKTAKRSATIDKVRYDLPGGQPKNFFYASEKSALLWEWSGYAARQAARISTKYKLDDTAQDELRHHALDLILTEAESWNPEEFGEATHQNNFARYFQTILPGKLRNEASKLKRGRYGEDVPVSGKVQIAEDIDEEYEELARIPSSAIESPEQALFRKQSEVAVVSMLHDKLSPFQAALVTSRLNLMNYMEDADLKTTFGANIRGEAKTVQMHSVDASGKATGEGLKAWPFVVRDLLAQLEGRTGSKVQPGKGARWDPKVEKWIDEESKLEQYPIAPTIKLPEAEHLMKIKMLRNLRDSIVKNPASGVTRAGQQLGLILRNTLSELADPKTGLSREQMSVLSSWGASHTKYLEGVRVRTYQTDTVGRLKVRQKKVSDRQLNKFESAYRNAHKAVQKLGKTAAIMQAKGKSTKALDRRIKAARRKMIDLGNKLGSARASHRASHAPRPPKKSRRAAKLPRDPGGRPMSTIQHSEQVVQFWRQLRQTAHGHWLPKTGAEVDTHLENLTSHLGLGDSRYFDYAAWRSSLGVKAPVMMQQRQRRAEIYHSVIHNLLAMPKAKLKKFMGKVKSTRAAVDRRRQKLSSERVALLVSQQATGAFLGTKQAKGHLGKIRTLRTRMKRTYEVGHHASLQHDTSAVNAANKEMKKLQRQQAKLEKHSLTKKIATANETLQQTNAKLQAVNVSLADTEREFMTVGVPGPEGKEIQIPYVEGFSHIRSYVAARHKAKGKIAKAEDSVLTSSFMIPDIGAVIDDLILESDLWAAIHGV